MSELPLSTVVVRRHPPYECMVEGWPHGEQWIREVAMKPYLPLLKAIDDHDFEGERVNTKITILNRPIFAKLAADATVLRAVDYHIDEKIARRGFEEEDDFEEDEFEDDDLEDDDLEDDDLEDDDFEDDDFEDDDLEDDDFEEDEELSDRQKIILIPVEGSEWWGGHLQIIEFD